MEAKKTPLNIYQKLAAIRKQVEVMKKDTKAYGYNYTKEETILAKITVFMEKYHLSLIPGIQPGTTTVEPFEYEKTKPLSKGGTYTEKVHEIIVSSDMTWTWVDNDEPENRIVVPWAMVGSQTDASQAFGSGLTYSSRYFLLKYFNIATSNDDPDSFRTKQKEAEAEADRMILEKIVEETDGFIKGYLDRHPDDESKARVKEIAARYARNGNYFNIKEPLVASALLEELKGTLGDGTEGKE